MLNGSIGFAFIFLLDFNVLAMFVLIVRRYYAHDILYVKCMHKTLHICIKVEVIFLDAFLFKSNTYRCVYNAKRRNLFIVEIIL